MPASIAAAPLARRADTPGSRVEKGIEMGPSSAIPAANQMPAPGSTELRGARPLAARLTWLVIFALTLIEFVIRLPGALEGFQQACAQSCLVSAETAQALAHVGITLHTYAWIVVALYCIMVFVSALLALALFWRRSRDWLALVVALFLIIYPTSNLLSGAITLPTVEFSLAALLQFLAGLPANLIFYLVFLLFPSGRFVPRWSWLLLLAWVGFSFAGTFNVGGGAAVIGYPLLFGSAIACQVYRYRRASTSTQRQQTKWVVFGFIGSLLANQAFWLPSGLTPLGKTLYAPVSYIVYLLFLLLLPITFSIAMQRHRLFDIDIIINRTLVYGPLTAILAAIYAGGIIGLQRGFHALSGQDSPLAVVLSTLLIAALFQPLRRRLQRAIDRRFFRTKYDAQKTLAAFNDTLRSQVDLTELSAHLVAVVDEAMRPAHLSLWLRDPAARVSTMGLESAGQAG